MNDIEVSVANLDLEMNAFSDSKRYLDKAIKDNGDTTATLTCEAENIQDILRKSKSKNDVETPNKMKK